jgi:arylsulfatase A-like enzyme
MSHDHLQRLDRMLAEFFTFLDRKVGADNVLVVLTADHGFANTPEFVKSNGVEAGRIGGSKLSADLNSFLAAKYGIDKLVVAQSTPNFYLDYAAIEQRGLARADVENTAARFLRAQPGVNEVYTRTSFEANATGGTRMGMLMRRAWNRELSGDLVVVTKPNWYFSWSNSGTSHGSPYAYDTNVPLVLSGRKWIKPGYYGQYAETVDIAPTLANLLHLRPPAGSEGRVLTELLQTQ